MKVWGDLARVLVLRQKDRPDRLSLHLQVCPGSEGRVAIPTKSVVLF